MVNWLSLWRLSRERLGRQGVRCDQTDQRRLPPVGRRRHWRQVSTQALTWARKTGGWVLTVSGFLGLAVGTILIWLFRASPWVLVIAFPVVLMVALYEGSYRVWDKQERQLTAAVGGVDQHIEWLRSTRIDRCRGTTGTLEGGGRVLAPVLPMWNRESYIWAVLDTAFKCPEEEGASSVWDTIPLLRSRDLIEEGRYRQAAPGASNPGTTPYSLALTISGVHPVPQDLSFSELRWTEMGQAVANRLIGDEGSRR